MKINSTRAKLYSKAVASKMILLLCPGKVKQTKYSWSHLEIFFKKKEKQIKMQKEIRKKAEKNKLETRKAAE